MKLNYKKNMEQSVKLLLFVNSSHCEELVYNVML